MAERKSSKHNIRKGLVDILTSLEFVKIKKVKKSVNIAFRRGKPFPLIYIHGSGFDGSLWWRQLKEVGGYAVDLPGHGLSGEARVETVDDYAFYVARAVKKLWVKPSLLDIA